MRFAVLAEVRAAKLVRLEVFETRAKALEAAGLSEEPMSQENVEIVRRAYTRTDRAKSSRLRGRSGLAHPRSPRGPAGLPRARGRRPRLRAKTEWNSIPGSHNSISPIDVAGVEGAEPTAQQLDALFGHGVQSSLRST